MRIVNVSEARANLSRLLVAVSNGEKIIIAKAGNPIVQLVPVAKEKKRQRKFGRLKGKIRIGDDFDDPLPPEVLRDFGIE